MRASCSFLAFLGILGCHLQLVVCQEVKGLHLAGDTAQLHLGPNMECTLELKPGPPPYLESSCPILAPPPLPPSSPSPPSSPVPPLMPPLSPPAAPFGLYAEGAWLLCAALQLDSSVSGWTFLSSSWSQQTGDFAFLTPAGIFRHAGNRCPDLDFTGTRQLKVRLYEGFETDSFTFSSGSNPFTTLGGNMYTSGSSQMGIRLRSENEWGLPMMHSSGGSCVDGNNTADQASSICVSDGSTSKAILGNVNGAAWRGPWMCSTNAQCGTDRDSVLLIFYQ